MQSGEDGPRTHKIRSGRNTSRPDRKAPESALDLSEAQGSCALTGCLVADRVRSDGQVWADRRAVEVAPEGVERDLHGGSVVLRVGDGDVGQARVAIDVVDQ